MREIRRVNRFFLILIVAYMGISMLWGFIPIGDSILMRRLTVLLPELIMLVIALIYWKRSRISFGRLIRFHRLSPVVIVLLIVFSIIILPFVTLLNAISMMFATNIVSTELSGMLTNSLAFGLFSIGIVPAFVEETVYRGILCQTYVKYHWLKAVVLSGFLFGIMHGNLNQFFYAWILGMLFAVVVEVTDSILSSMIVHFMINGVNVVGVFLMEKYQALVGTNSDSVIQESNTTYLNIKDIIGLLPSGLVCLLIAMGILFLIGRLSKRSGVLRQKIEEGNKINRETEVIEDNFGKKRMKLWTWHLTVAFVLCLMLAITVEMAARI